MSDDSTELATVDANIDMVIEAIRAQAFNRGYDIATSRAESRAALGLPIERGVEKRIIIVGADDWADLMGEQTSDA